MKKYHLLPFLVLLMTCFHVNAQLFTYDFSSIKHFDFSAVNNDGDTLYYNIISNDPPEVAVANCMSKDSVFMKEVIECLEKTGLTYYNRDYFRFDYDSVLTIPSTVKYDNKTYTVTAISERAFLWQHKIHTIILPETIDSIAYHAFYNSYLTKINIPENLTYIGDGAFGLTTIDSVVLPQKISYIGPDAFTGTNIRTIDIPANLKMLNGGLFKYCPFLEHITLHEGLQFIEYGALTECKKLDSLYIPSTVDSIGTFSDYALNDSCYFKHIEFAPNPDTLYLPEYFFANCVNLNSVIFRENTILTKGCFKYCTGLKSLEHIKIPECNTEIPEECFINCSSLEHVSIPESIITIQKKAFSGCTNLQTIELPETIETIPESAFLSCEKLQTIKLPDSLKTINEQAFRFCKSLKSIVIPEKVSTIGDRAFLCSPYKSDTTLTEIWMMGSTPPVLKGGHNFPNNYDILVHIPCKTTSIYANAKVWGSSLYKFKYHEECTGVEEHTSDGDITIFPNPTVGTLNVASDNQEISKIELYNNIGKLIGIKENCGNDSTMSIDQPSGIYFLSVTLSDGSRSVKKIIKK